MTTKAAAYPSHEATPSSRPFPKPCSRYSINPPWDGYRIPSLTTLYASSAVTSPARRNESQTADPAMTAAWPRRAKIPAPTIEPMPMNAAPRTLMCARESDVMSTARMHSYLLAAQRSSRR